ncbi:Pal1 cell morphology protein-domain-containing protein [Lasiosphaeria miniovina]|uniref:Pal1 cell morphology protein-domain-containing protein n=1 Tax=Lasiosphaeria miniovina TaxID=1954250 RepID=A0AA40DKT2_9PEZI|nr:Pal1 cell morphology protein-domain-containing protein [Lasiosphaeria miniovina]KAK0703488.1 Pal1 cell morphology protein-domain-containing protein [Lasiosphaeria miniovina]
MHGADGQTHRSLSDQLLTFWAILPRLGHLDLRSAGLTLNLSSNNPFRNRAVSPALAASPASPFDDPPPRPLSRNPFLDPSVAARPSLPNIKAASDTMSPLDKKPSSPTAEDIFGSLTLDDQKAPPPYQVSPPLGPPKPDAVRPPQMGRRGPPPPGRDDLLPTSRRGPPPNHRPTRSQEEALRRKMQANGEGSALPDPSRSPQRRSDRRPRRNSESSAVDREKPTTEEEKKLRELRRRDREARRQRDNRDRDKKPPNRKLDIIDQLDATSIYGTGMFHHDGPFDALNPHRNKQGSRRAPMEAFPKDSLNNVLGGSGPLNVRPDHAAFLGQHDDEAFKEWSASGKDRLELADYPPPSKGEARIFDPLSRSSILHGDESMGLGTSTFLEGTPAARTAIQKRQEEEADNEGLQRKKSLAQRIRNINRGGRDYQPSGRMAHPDGYYASRRSPSDSWNQTSASMQTPANESNPFFSEFEQGKKGEEAFNVRNMDSNGNRVSPASPKGYSLERRVTTDATMSAEESQPKPSGILGRMKSLKGGRRARQNNPPSTDMGTNAPGTAV